MLRAGIVGLPNVGKSTLFNALTSQTAALAANYPFATIEPNVGVVPVPDERLEPLAKVVKTNTIIPATVERRRERAQKTAKSGDKPARAEIDVLDKIQPALEEGKPARVVSLTDDERAIARGFFLLTMKPTIYAANVDEATLSEKPED